MPPDWIATALTRLGVNVLIKAATRLFKESPARIRVAVVFEFLNGDNDGPFLKVVVENRQLVSMSVESVVLRPRGGNAGIRMGAILEPNTGPKLPIRLAPGEHWRGLARLTEVLSRLRSTFPLPNDGYWKLVVMAN